MAARFVLPWAFTRETRVCTRYSQGVGEGERVFVPSDEEGGLKRGCVHEVGSPWKEPRLCESLVED